MNFRFRNFLRHGFSLAVFLGIATLTLAAPAMAQGGELRRGVAKLPTSFDVHTIGSSTDFEIFCDLYAGLTMYRPDGTPMMAVAEDYTLSADRLTATFTLREDALWSDGEPVKAQDFVFAFRRYVNPAVEARYPGLADFLRNAPAIRKGQAEPESLGVRAVDAKTLEIQLDKPTPYLLDLLAQPVFAPLPAHRADANGMLELTMQDLVSNGPFTLSDTKTDERWTLTKNERFFDADAVALDRVVYAPAPTSEALIDVMESGELHINYRYPRYLGGAIDSRLPGFREVHEGARIYYLAFNTAKPPFDDARVREAFGLLINRDLLTRGPAGELVNPARRKVSPVIARAKPAPLPDEPEELKGRIRRAEALLTEAGYGPDNVLNFDMRWFESGSGRRLALNAPRILQFLWRHGRPYVRPDGMETESDTHYQALFDGDFDVAIASWICDFNDPRAYLFMYDSADNKWNHARYESSAFSRLLDQAQAEPDPEKRAEFLAQAEGLVLESYAIVPLWHEATYALVSPIVSGWEPTPMDMHLSRWMSLQEN